MRYDEIRTCVQAMLQESLQRTIARLDTQGPLHNFNAVVEDGTRSLLAAGPEDYWEMVGPEEIERSLQKVTTFSGRSRDEIEASRADVLELYRVGLLAYWDAVKDHRRKLQSVELLPVGGREGSVQGKIPEQIGTKTNLNATLSDVVNQYIDENWQAGVWVARTRDKQKATLGVLIELLGGSTLISCIGMQEAQDVKIVVRNMPANKNKNPKTRDLSLRDAAKVPGVQRLSSETVNFYLGAYYTFFDWAMKNGYAREKLFDGMKVKTKRDTSDADSKRSPFPDEAVSKMIAELVRPDSRLVKKECYRWASLIGIFTGARLNEVCSLRVSDVEDRDGILCVNINDEDPDNNKSLKTAAARRLVPVHSKLIELGFADFVGRRKVDGHDARLFKDFHFSPKHGYGRNEGRWFNENFLPALGLKTEQHVFHGLRHTLITRLHQASVPQPLVQTLVGHEREGVTMKTYFSEGYTVAQLKEAIECFRIAMP
jgi:integrase